MFSETFNFLPGGRSVDHRGQVSYVNDFPFSAYKRFYVIENREVGYVRAWHGHKVESKAYFLISGSAMVGAVKIDSWDSPSPDCEVQTKILDSNSPGTLFIPAGYANGFMSLEPNTKVLLFSDFSLEESLEDDIRFDPYLWDPWTAVRANLSLPEGDD